MKTITRTTTQTVNQLEIRYCDCVESPREWINLGYFITIDKNYDSPDNNEDIINIVKYTGEIADSQEEHIELIKKEIENNLDEKVIAIYPITKYEHGRTYYSLGTIHGFDNSNNGFYIITEKTQKEVGIKKEDFEKEIKRELDIYNKYINGEVYEFILYDNNGEVADACSGFYDIEDIREYLPEEWKNEKLEEYLIEN